MLQVKKQRALKGPRQQAQQQQQQVHEQQPAAALVLRPLTRSQVRSSQPTSLSAVLQARSEQAARPTSARAALPNIDVDGLDPMAACDYVLGIYRFFRRVEPNFQVAPDYMSTQVRCPGL